MNVTKGEGKREREREAGSKGTERGSRERNKEGGNAAEKITVWGCDGGDLSSLSPFFPLPPCQEKNSD